MQKVRVEPIKLMGISVRTTNENGKSAKDIPELWNKFMSQLIINKIQNKVDENIYSVYTDYDSDHTKPYTAFLGCKVTSSDNQPEGLYSLVLNSGNYIRITTRGDLTKGLIINEWMKIWEMEIDRIYKTDFEVYGEKSQNPMDAEVDIFVGVK